MGIALLIIVCAAGVAWANGANDVSKGVATLVGSRLASYRQGLAWGTIWTVAGAVAALALTTSIFRTFSTGLINETLARAPLFSLAVAVGAFAWVLIASRTGLPVSTTHSLIGAIVGAALAADGVHGVRWPLVVSAVAAPLALSPIVAAGLSYLTHALAIRRLSTVARYCVCVTERPLVVAPTWALSGAVAAQPVVLPLVVVDDQRACATEQTIGAVGVIDVLHWTTAAALSFARGLNDAPKIAALAIAAAATLGVAAPPLYLIGAVVMGAGSYLGGRRVTETLAERVTDIDPLEGLAASGIAAALVLAASFVALPVSTTHVASGAIVGVGLRSGRGVVRWSTVSAMMAAWAITLPASAVVSAAAWRLGMLLRGA